MLTSLRFKNWRSLRDVTIDNLTPITVFVGANSSGKTNILDALHFWRYAHGSGVREAVFAWGGAERILHVGADARVIELETVYHETQARGFVSDSMKMTFGFSDTSLASIVVDHRVKEGDHILRKMPPNDVMDETPRILGTEVFAVPDRGEYDRQKEIVRRTEYYPTQRWQLLRENFMPDTSVPANNDVGDLYTIHALAKNVPLMLDFMQQTDLTLYQALQEDLSWLHADVVSVTTERTDREIQMAVSEASLKGHKAPTISGGTLRILAMLTAYHALDMRDASLPGLVVIEEPDTAIHPLLLGKLVSLLRQYTSRDDAPRQFILTTHNPMLLNLFTPEEVRIVERDEHGETTVKAFDPTVVEAWRKEEGAYNLGDLWTTRLAGGVPE